MGRRVFFLVVLFTLANISISHAGFETRPSAQGVAGPVPGPDGIGNPAVWSDISGLLATFRFYQPWGFKELQTLRAGVGIHAGPGVWVVDVSHFGGDLYQEFTGSAAMAMKLFEESDVGITGNYHHLSIADAGSASSFSLDAGFRLTMTEAIRLGVAVDNVFQSTIGKSREPLPFRLKTGVWLAFSEWLECGADWIREAGYDQDFQIILQLNLTNDIRLYSGWLQGSKEYSAGGTVKTGAVSLQYHTYIHTHLGLTHDVGISVSLGESETLSNREVIFPVVEKEKGSAKSSRVVSLIEINQAGEKEWDQLPGVSSSLARSIVNWRIKRAGFQSIDELIGVPGMTPELLEKIRPYVRLLSNQSTHSN